MIQACICILVRINITLTSQRRVTRVRAKFLALRTPVQYVAATRAYTPPKKTLLIGEYGASVTLFNCCYFNNYVDVKNSQCTTDPCLAGESAKIGNK
jgi:hypothetical protein